MEQYNNSNDGLGELGTKKEQKINKLLTVTGTLTIEPAWNKQKN